MRNYGKESKEEKGFEEKEVTQEEQEARLVRACSTRKTLDGRREFLVTARARVVPAPLACARVRKKFPRCRIRRRIPVR